ncbi:hypothetical protein SAMIE_1015370 [Sphingobium amiense]|uniref:Uncharacterized protein n=1 Tax=Sphingobium amiense TaxID=135719 RepID=A0A494W3W1_9SPHN|nr:hypothetical protein [Sphingobium amiense]BBD98036.1 hypothetical protein SAMIE_1015370 [Sphingobium amiense]
MIEGKANPRFGPNEKALRIAMDRASVFASDKRYSEDLTRLQITAVRVTIPAIVSGLARLDDRRKSSKHWNGEISERAFEENEADAALWLLWLDVARAVFKQGAPA